MPPWVDWAIEGHDELLLECIYEAWHGEEYYTSEINDYSHEQKNYIEELDKAKSYHTENVSLTKEMQEQSDLLYQTYTNKDMVGVTLPPVVMLALLLWKLKISFDIKKKTSVLKALFMRYFVSHVKANDKNKVLKSANSLSNSEAEKRGRKYKRNAKLIRSKSKKIRKKYANSVDLSETFKQIFVDLENCSEKYYPKDLDIVMTVSWLSTYACNLTNSFINRKEKRTGASTVRQKIIGFIQKNYDNDSSVQKEIKYDAISILASTIIKSA